jgi:hypothetical protein
LGLKRGRSIKIDFDLLPFQPAKLLQDGDEFNFIIHRVEAQAKFGYEVMTVNKIRHGNDKGDSR